MIRMMNLILFQGLINVYLVVRVLSTTRYGHRQDIWLSSIPIHEYGGCASGCKELQAIGSHMCFLQEWTQTDLCKAKIKLCTVFYIYWVPNIPWISLQNTKCTGIFSFFPSLSFYGSFNKVSAISATKPCFCLRCVGVIKTNLQKPLFRRYNI